MRPAAQVREALEQVVDGLDRIERGLRLEAYARMPGVPAEDVLDVHGVPILAPVLVAKAQALAALLVATS